MTLKTSDSQKLTIDVASMTLFKIVAVVLALFFLFYVRDVLVIFFVSLILASAFDPWVDWLQKHKLPRSLSILFIYGAAMFVLSLATYLIIPPIITEVNQLTQDFPVYWERAVSGFESVKNYTDARGWDDNIQGALNYLRASIAPAAGGVFHTAFSFFGGVISFFLVLVITFYMIVEEQSMKRLLRSVVPVKHQPYATHLVNRMQQRIGQWLRGQLILSLIMMVMVWSLLTILGVKYALVLAVFAGIAELVPYIGPWIGGAPAVFVAFTQSPLLALVVIIAYIIIQFIDGNFTVPKVMQKAVGLSPVITILAVLLGAKVAGFLGIILAVPVATAMSVVINDILEAKNT